MLITTDCMLTATGCMLMATGCMLMATGCMLMATGCMLTVPPGCMLMVPPGCMLMVPPHCMQVGTPDYMAPEIIDETESVHRPPIDMWATGAILYVLLVGRPPFGDASDLNTLLANITTGNFDKCAAEDWAPISGHAKDLVLKLLEPKVSRRLTAKQMLVHPWLHFANTAADGGELPSTPSRLKKYNARRRLQKAALAVRLAQMHKKAAAAIAEQKGVGGARTRIAP